MLGILAKHEDAQHNIEDAEGERDRVQAGLSSPLVVRLEGGDFYEYTGYIYNKSVRSGSIIGRCRNPFC